MVLDVGFAAFLTHDGCLHPTKVGSLATRLTSGRSVPPDHSTFRDDGSIPTFTDDSEDARWIFRCSNARPMASLTGAAQTAISTFWKPSGIASRWRRRVSSFGMVSGRIASPAASPGT